MLTTIQKYIRNNLKVCAALLLCASSLPSLAQNYPNRPIKLIIPYGPGASNDTVARLIGPYLAETLGQPVVIENRPGAGGVVAANFVAKSAPDGYNLLMGSPGPLTVNPSMLPNLPYNVKRDLAPIALVAIVPSILQIDPKLPVKSVKELIAYAKANPGRLNYASTGIGSMPHLAGELFKMLGTVDMVHVPYKGSSAATADFLAGRVDVFFDNMPSALPYVKAGTLRALAITSPARSEVIPDVPTMIEAGVPGYEAYSWNGIVVPAGTPKEIVNRLAGAITTVLGKAEVRERMKSIGAEVVNSSPTAFADFMDKETSKWARVIKEGNIKPE